METVCPENTKSFFSSNLNDFRSFRTSCSDFIQTWSRKITAHTFFRVESQLEGRYSNSSPSVLSSREKEDVFAAEVHYKASLVYARYLQQQLQVDAATTLATATLPAHSLCFKANVLVRITTKWDICSPFELWCGRPWKSFRLGETRCFLLPYVLCSKALGASILPEERNLPPQVEGWKFLSRNLVCGVPVIHLAIKLRTMRRNPSLFMFMELP